MLKVTLIRSYIKATKSQIGTVRGLGLNKLHASRVLQDTPAIRGMIRTVGHLVECTEVSE